MKKNLGLSAIAGAIVGAAALVGIALDSQRNVLAAGYYSGYGSSYGSNSAYGYSPYGYRTARGYTDSSNSGYGHSAPYDGTPGTLYYGHAAPRSYNPYGYGGDRAYGGGSPYFGHAYAPFGYGTYSAYGY